jgi:hypothetical protein
MHTYNQYIGFERLFKVVFGDGRKNVSSWLAVEPLHALLTIFSLFYFPVWSKELRKIYSRKKK